MAKSVTALAAGPALPSGPAAPVDVAGAPSAPVVPLPPMVDPAPAAAAPATPEPVMPEPALPEAALPEPPVPATMPAPAATMPAPTVPTASSLPSPQVAAAAPGRETSDPSSPPPFAPAQATAPGVPGAPAGPSRRRAVLIGAGVGVAVVLGVIGAFVFGGGGGSDDGGDAGSPSVVTEAPVGTTGSTPTPSPTPSSVEVTVAPTAASTTVAATVAPTAVTPTTAEKNVCSGRTAPCIVLTGVKVTDTGAIEVTWEPFNFVPDVGNGLHAHLYWNNLTAEQAGANGAEGQGQWDAHDETIHTSSVLVVATKPPNATEVCVTVGLAPDHNVPRPDIFHCLPLPEPGG